MKKIKTAKAPQIKPTTLSNVKERCGLHFTVKHTGKMEGLMSISTSTLTNERCRKNAQVKGSVCERCFAEAQMKYRPTMQPCFARNQEILTAAVIDPELLPLINALYFRFEAFGDLNNDIQVMNYFNICYKNPNVKMALWTKNPDIISQAIEKGYKKPENLEIVYSSKFLNKEIKYEVISKKYPFIDKIFTVFTKEFIKENNVEINCGARSCFGCGLCYNHNEIRYVREILK